MIPVGGRFMWEQERVGGGSDGLEPCTGLQVQKSRSNTSGCKVQADKSGVAH